MPDTLQDQEAGPASWVGQGPGTGKAAILPLPPAEPSAQLKVGVNEPTDATLTPPQTSASTPDARSQALRQAQDRIRAWTRERSVFRAKKEWVCRVESVDDGFFRAQLTSRESPGDLEEAEIDIEEISPRDLPYLKPGAIFYWVIGYRDEANGGQRRGVSSLHFRRGLPLSNEDYSRADAHANAWLEILND